MTRPDLDKTDSNNADKKEIADEEREKMLNEENEKHKGAEAATISPPSLSSNTDVEPRKKKIPIGGIKMPGFCRPKSKEEFPRDESGEQQAVEESEVGILDAMRRPLVNVLASIKKSRPDGELSAELASVETLDGSVGEKIIINDTAPPAITEDGMETVRLDGDPDGGEFNEEKMNPQKPGPLQVLISTARRNHLVTGVILGVLLIVIIIITVACAGPRRMIVQPLLKDGKYMEAVTSCGLVQGILEDGGFAFRGIPYALPPVNSLRWRSAQPINRIEYCWNGTYLAHNSSNSCWQRDALGNAGGDEDCLYLDVFTPQVRYDTPLPVVVMIGAETLSGGSPGVMQPSAKLARVRDMVFVRPNFRLGIFGFLSAKALSRSTHLPTSGNYALSDIIVALKWVQLNIQNFGGDEKSVTIWGHRAGGTLVTCLLAATHPIKNLFSRAWISSPSVALPTKNLEISEKLSEPFLNAVRCNDAACLRNKTPQELINAEPSSWYNTSENSQLPAGQADKNPSNRHEWLVIDGAIIPENVYDTFKHVGTPVKVVMGTTVHSAAPHSHWKNLNGSMDHLQIEKSVNESLLGKIGLSDEVVKRYNATLHGLATIITEIRVLCPIYNLTNMVPPNNISFYIATQPRWGQLADADSDVAAILGSYTLFTPEEKRHQSAIQQLFNQFVWHNRIIDAAKEITYGYNNHHNYSQNARKIIVVGQDILPQHGYPNCDYWIKNNLVPKYARID
ncbi:neurotactin [Diachasma alloeum]|uniref:neurotactin n=1 Tax=Diachasma alloeum TaxID=454923 RepID=UPI0007382D0A|nr:neurotactin [Diachasma alloeum]